MKCITIVIDIGFEDLILDMLRSLKIENYIKLPVVYGRLGSAEPLLGTPIFPGQMVMYKIYSPDSSFDIITSELKKINEKLKDKNFLACYYDIEII